MHRVQEEADIKISTLELHSLALRRLKTRSCLCTHWCRGMDGTNMAAHSASSLPVRE